MFKPGFRKVECTDQMPQPYLDERDVAQRTKMSVAWVRKQRQLGLPPRAIKIGRSVRYRPEDVSDWLASLAK
jgi:predicted DNA-binding transcriptional regulator AlpA